MPNAAPSVKNARAASTEKVCARGRRPLRKRPNVRNLRLPLALRKLLAYDSAIRIRPNFTGTLDLSECDGVSLEIYNPDRRNKQILLQFASAKAADCDLYLRHQDEPAWDLYGKRNILSAGPGWSKVCFRADAIHVGKGGIVHGKSLLRDVTSITVLVTDPGLEKKSYLLVDNIGLFKLRRVTPAAANRPDPALTQLLDQAQTRLKKRTMPQVLPPI